MSKLKFSQVFLFLILLLLMMEIVIKIDLYFRYMYYIYVKQCLSHLAQQNVVRLPIQSNIAIANFKLGQLFLQKQVIGVLQAIR